MSSSPASAPTPAPPTEAELAQVQKANLSGRPTAVFVHGLWLLASCWDRWRDPFEASGYATVTVDWPDDPATVSDGRANPDAFAGKGIGDVTGHIAAVVDRLDTKPVLIGHSFGGLIVQKLAGMGRAGATIPIDPAPFRGVLPLPRSSLKAGSPVLGHPGTRNRAVMLTYPQFRFSFANAVTETESRELYDTYAVPAPGKPLWQAALANLNPATEAKVATRFAQRGPMKFLSGGKDNTVPWALTHAAYKRQRRNQATTEIEEVPNRGHALVIDSGWETVAAIALDFAKQHVGP